MGRLIGREPVPTGRTVGDLAALRLVWPYLWPKQDPALRWRLGGAMVLLCAMAAINAAMPQLFAAAIDGLAGPVPARADPGAPADGGALLPWSPLLLLAGYGLMHWTGKVIGEARWAIYGPIEQRVQRRLALDAFRHVHSLSLRFHLDRRTGQLARVLDNGLRGVRELLFDAVFLVLPFLAEILFVTLMVMRQFDGLYAAIMVATLGSYAVVMVIGARRLRRHQRDALRVNAAAQGRAIDSLLNYETVKLFGNEAHDAARYDQSLRQVEHCQTRLLLTRALIGGIQASIVAAGLTAMVLLAGRDVMAGGMTIGAMVLINTYLLQLIRPLERVGTLYRSIKLEITHVEQMVVLFEERPEVVDRPDAVVLPDGPGRLELDAVGFAYGPARGVLHGITATVAPGRTLALVGPTGAGKSTIARLLFRFYDPHAGAIRIDGRDLRAATQDSVRAAIGVVPQEPVLFNETIGFNIGFGRPDAGRDAIEAAARAAELHDFIASLPDGYDTLVGERGLKLSGGEKQRVAIARAVLKQPRIFLFDEATSALDSRHETLIQANLRRVSEGRTTVVIAHRLSTVVDADEILFIDHGRITERGRHADLLARGGGYAALWAHQSREAATPPETDGTDRIPPSV